jgi:DNA-binding transcriptional ArsR family regulator
VVIFLDKIEQHANLFKALSDPTRLKLIRLLGENATRRETHEGAAAEANECPPPHACEGQGFLCVNALAHRLGVTQSAVSQHLRVLRQAGLVRSTRRGAFVHYSPDPEGLARVKAALGETLGEELAG